MRSTKMMAIVAVAACVVTSPALAQVDLGLDDCSCEGPDCNYPVYCPQYTQHLAENIAAEVDHARQVEAPAPVAPPPVAPTPAGGLLGRFFGGRTEQQQHSTAANTDTAAALGPRIYMSDEEMIVCKSYEPSGGVSAFSPTQSSIRIPDEMDLVSMTVDLNVTHERIGALKVELEAKSGKRKPRKAILKPRGWGGSGQNMLSTTFDDESDVNFPKAQGAPFSESYRPKGKLRRFIRGKGYKAAKGGTKGMWTLRVTDVGRNPDTRTAVINNWRVNMCGKVDMNREKTPMLSQDILEAAERRAEATEEQMPVQIACPGATLTADGQCPLNAVDVVQSLLDGTYNSTYGIVGWNGEESGDEIAAAQGILVPEIDGLPRSPLRTAYDDYVDRFNAWADTLPKLSEYLTSLPSGVWELMIGYVYFNWLIGTLECVHAGDCGKVVNNIPETLVIG
ncbi:hypothetical protein HOP50_13g70130 [Chloropicon primus]|nr:hypothetical protein A3770_13p69920 [Chloropicon primus]UPR03683.1 hypothetical protein HOP50_13g70130 [Chloropicon primus]|eukprot:QDZ24474.1 hypothetical protein A3770_13p69920 [Chloropicon primus]